MENKEVRLIDANALLETICKKCPEYDCKPDATDTVSGCLIYDVIASAPTIDAQPVKRGKWISEKVQKKDWKGIERSYFQPNSCSVCHIGVAVRTEFCPKCGARMEVDKNEQTQ